MPNSNVKVCPLVRQQCIKDQCEFFNDALKKCQVSVLSYNFFRLTDARTGKAAARKDKEQLVFGDRQVPGNPLGEEFF
jgi:hypothetical protein